MQKLESNKDKDKDKELEDVSIISKSSLKIGRVEKLRKKTLGMSEKDGEFIKRSRIGHKGSLKKLNSENLRKINSIRINENNSELKLKYKKNKLDCALENNLQQGKIFLLNY